MEIEEDRICTADKISLRLGFGVLAFVALTLAQKSFALQSSILPSTTQLYPNSRSSKIKISQKFLHQPATIFTSARHSIR